MTPDQRILVVGLYISASLYLTGCFVVSLFVQHGQGWKPALGSVAAAYCAYSVQVMFPDCRRAAAVFVIVSQAWGLAAGIIVLFGG